MLFQLIVGPFSTLHTLPKGMGVLLLTMTAIISSISLGTTGVKVRLHSLNACSPAHIGQEVRLQMVTSHEVSDSKEVFVWE